MSNFAIVKALFLKPARGASMTAPRGSILMLKAGHGIEGDVNAHPMSPRQVLITRAEDLEAFNLSPGNLRENIVIKGLDENVFQPGAVLHIGNDVKVRLTFHCEPCKRIGHLVSLHDIRDRRGILGVILQDGHIAIDHQVSCLTNQFPPLSDIPYERFLAFVSQIPYGNVVTYREVLIGMGVAESYARAIPNYIRRTSQKDYPVHRILDSQGALISAYVPNQMERLAEEGVETRRNFDLFGQSVELSIELSKYAWVEALYIA